ncbi:MAG: class I SAM-dependent methyltransferase [Gammaproteobacteria bacterium]|nr:class I SAM-dependent methyltransferase [Gammaproteobacteria bacterium]
MSLYERYILPELIQYICNRKQFKERRQSILHHAKGTVLDIGMGSGTNLPFLKTPDIKHIFGLEPSERLRHKAMINADKLDLRIEPISNGAEDIPLEKHSVDTAILTFTMCTIPDIDKALKEINRVLKPGGQLLFCEHGRAPDENILRWQNRLNPVWKKIAGGCNLNRNIPELIKQADFKIQTIDQSYMPGPKAMSFIHKGVAVK